MLLVLPMKETKKQLFSVGDLCIDILQEISGGVKFGEEHSLEDLELSVGGNAANFSVIAAKLGLKPVLISAIGTGLGTPFLKKQLADAGVSMRLAKSRENNAFSMILVNKRGERAIESTKTSLNGLSSKDVARSLLPKLKAGGIVFFGGFYHLPKMRPGFRALLQKIKKKRATVCFDTCFDTHGVWNIDGFLPFIDYLFVNDIELKHIAKGGTMQQRVNMLFKKGANAVVVKQASQGAALFVKNFPSGHFPSVAGKVVDTTGAGDAFNAGFVFGLMNGWGLDNCMRSANFVAAKKIQVHGLAAPVPGALNRFIAIHNEPTLVVAKNSGEMSKVAAQRVVNLLKRKPGASIALPTGETPKQMYNLLVQAFGKGEADFSKAHFFALDEYAGLSQDNKNSFSYFLMQHFLGKVNAKKQNIHLLNGAAANLRAECAKHEAAITKKGIDLCLLGIGRNGHIAFNEPGSCSYGITRTVMLMPETRKANGAGFTEKLAPAKALTVGLRTIRENSGKILLLASGRQKTKAISGMLKSNDFLRWPAVALKRHRNFMIVADRAAVSKAGGV